MRDLPQKRLKMSEKKRTIRKWDPGMFCVETDCRTSHSSGMKAKAHQNQTQQHTHSPTHIQLFHLLNGTYISWNILPESQALLKIKQIFENLLALVHSYLFLV